MKSYLFKLTTLPKKTQILLVACLFAGILLAAWYVSERGPHRPNIADVTKPARGFENFTEFDETPPLIALETIEKPSSQVDSEVFLLKQQNEELQQLLHEKEARIKELQAELEDLQHQTEIEQESILEKSLLKEFPEEKVAEKSTPRIHVVKKGETLSEISRQYYGSGARWQAIYQANIDKLNDKNRVPVGTELIIPE